MQADPTHNAALGFALFDAWLKSVEAREHCGGHAKGSALVDAAFKAFDHYVDVVEFQHAAQIAAVGAQVTGQAVTTAPGVTSYARNPHGDGALPVTIQDMAPFLALNVMG